MSLIRRFLERTGGGTEERTMSPTGGEKATKLARFDLIPADALWQVAELYGAGAAKYADRNWEKGYPWSLSIAALERHLALWKDGEAADPETKASHLASVVFHALALMRFEAAYPELDDRSGSLKAAPDNATVMTVDPDGKPERPFCSCIACRDLEHSWMRKSGY